MMKKPNPVLAIALGAITLLRPTTAAGQSLETETARLLPAGEIKLAGNYEAQTSSEGREFAVPLAVEFGVTDRLEFLAEPVPYTSIRPNNASWATGWGDLELTMTYLLRDPGPGGIAVAVAGEAKIPTARNTLIGTLKTDYTGYLIASTTHGRWRTHGNVGYSTLGKPAGIQLNNIFNFALAEEYDLGGTSHLFGEILASTSSGVGEGEGNPNPTVPLVSEIAGAELVGTLGYARELTSGLELSGSLSYDNNQAVLLRTTFSYRIH